MKRLLLVCLMVTLCVLPNVDGNIGSTLGMSQSAYGSNGTYASDKSGVTWKYKGWIITEYYDSEGHCDEIVYVRSDDAPLSESTVLSLLRINTPIGVVWKEQQTGSGAFIGARKWHSTEYMKNELISDSLVAGTYPIPPNPVQGPVITLRYLLYIKSTSSRHFDWLPE